MCNGIGIARSCRTFGTFAFHRRNIFFHLKCVCSMYGTIWFLSFCYGTINHIFCLPTNAFCRALSKSSSFCCVAGLLFCTCRATFSGRIPGTEGLCSSNWWRFLDDMAFEGRNGVTCVPNVSSLHSCPDPDTYWSFNFLSSIISVTIRFLCFCCVYFWPGHLATNSGYASCMLLIPIEHNYVPRFG